MRRTCGIGITKDGSVGLLLLQSSRIDFDSLDPELGAYFDLIAPHFDDYAQAQCGTDLSSLNVMVVLERQDLLEAVRRIDVVIAQYKNGETRWLHYQGTEKCPGQDERKVYFEIERHRFFLALRWLRRLFNKAIVQNSPIAYGTGVCRRALCDIKSPHGTVTYS